MAAPFEIVGEPEPVSKSLAGIFAGHKPMRYKITSSLGRRRRKQLYTKLLGAFMTKGWIVGWELLTGRHPGKVCYWIDVKERIYLKAPATQPGYILREHAELADTIVAMLNLVALERGDA